MAPWLVIVSLCLATIACGKRGSPLAPIVRIPAPVSTIAAQRVAGNAYVTLTVPAQNIDLTIPSDVTHIDVYGYTGRLLPPPARFTALGRRVASIPVVPAPPLGAVNPPPPDPAQGGIQGFPVTIVDRLSADELEQGELDPPVVRRGPPLPAVPTLVLPLRRFYMAIPFGPRNRPGPPGATTEFTLTEGLEAPAGVAVTYSPGGVTVTWEPVGGLIGSLLEAREIPLEPPPFFDDAVAGLLAGPTPAVVAGTVVAPLPPGPTRYNLYRDVEPDPLAMPGPPVPLVPWRALPPVPVAPLLTLPGFVEAADFERTRCYAVRAVRGLAAAAVESDATPTVCIRPVDVFPPARPATPVAVPAEGAISLIWEPNSELDLGGYLVLRGEAGDATLAPLTETPVFEASYRDTTVMPGRRYVYAVQAVDNRVPLGNVSLPSAPVEETAR